MDFVLAHIGAKICLGLDKQHWLEVECTAILLLISDRAGWLAATSGGAEVPSIAFLARVAQLSSAATKSSSANILSLKGHKRVARNRFADFSTVVIILVVCIRKYVRHFIR